ncbi:alpha/beta hydrolase [Chelativorans sp. YIM 93263]|uniref:alpha/beta hydrolase n=1 Tax=Chelativorans sp. YIM 93263 TaxID=2906648 RepID=UPI0023799E47|nr:alpha/beta hydrolase [Chelativorans sp. YIM 93263]
MLERSIKDWDDAYANGPHIPGGDRWPALWAEKAQAFREELAATGRAKLDVPYGDAPRQQMDLFQPAELSRGLVVFVHGGYWQKFDKNHWSQFAAGSLARGYVVALPSYTLCPGIRIGGIVREIATAIEKAAEMVEGPIMLAGHSAGGHLVSRVVSEPTPLSTAVRGRIRRVISISGVHDLRPLMRTAMNENLGLDEAEALAESPALLCPVEGARITCWVGGGERAEFLRQNALLANIWTGLGATTSTVVEPDRHHFNVIDGLIDPHHALTRTLLSE